MGGALHRPGQGPNPHTATGGGNRAIVAALSANLGIAATKPVAVALTQSSSTHAESVHSVADHGDQVLPLLGGRRATPSQPHQPPSRYRRGRSLSACPAAATSSILPSPNSLP